MLANMWGNGTRTTMICIDNYENSVPVGRFYNRYCPDGVSFCGVMEFLKKMEAVLDENHAPQSFLTKRSFTERSIASISVPSGEVVDKGKVATFAVKVLFRQNASWQGSVSWVDGQREESFRSVLELLLLIDSAINTKDSR